MSKYDVPMKLHLYDRELNGTACKTRAFRLEYAKKLEDVNCERCKIVAERIKRSRERAETNKGLDGRALIRKYIRSDSN